MDVMNERMCSLEITTNELEYIIHFSAARPIHKEGIGTLSAC